MSRRKGGVGNGLGLHRWAWIGSAVSGVIMALVLMGCPQEPSGGAQCPPGADYDEDRQRCYSGDAGNNGADTGGDTQDDGGSSNGGGDSGGGGESDADGDDVSPPQTVCDNETLEERFSVFSVSESTFWGNLYATSGPEDGAFVAWSNAGSIEVLQVRADGSVKDSHSFSGAEVYGLAASDTAFALLIFREPDILALLVAEENGTVIHDETIIGDVDQSELGNEWFGTLIRDGRLIEYDGQWAAYYTLQRRSPNDGVAHYGDQLAIFEADGTRTTGGWSWGCSHSMELRISHNGVRLGPLCSSDCYPSKGVHFNHRGGMLWPDEESSDCRGQYGTTMGASVPVESAFWMVFTATDDRDSSDVAINRVEGFGASQDDTMWLTEDDKNATNPKAEMYGSDLLVAWTAGGGAQGWSQNFVLVSDPDGTVVLGPQDIAGAALASSSDFFVYTNGDVGWAQATSEGVELARLGLCP